MAESFSEAGLFKGTSPDECEGFVAMVRRRALEQGKHRDNEWMAVLASSYLGGEALYWYEDLEDSIQNDWSRLRPALLARFGARRTNPTATSSALVSPGSTSSTTIPTPAAAPPSVPPPSLIRKGRLKVLSSEGAPQRYIGRSGNTGNVSGSLCISPGEAVLVSFTTSAGRPFCIQIIDSPNDTQATNALAITWSGLTGCTWMTDPEYIAGCCSLSAIERAPWAVEQKVWEISKDGELSVEYPRPDGGSERLQAIISPNGNSLWWARPSGQRERHARIFLEDAI